MLSLDDRIEEYRGMLAAATKLRHKEEVAIQVQHDLDALRNFYNDNKLLDVLRKGRAERDEVVREEALIERTGQTDPV